MYKRQRSASSQIQLDANGITVGRNRHGGLRGTRSHVRQQVTRASTRRFSQESQEPSDQNGTEHQHIRWQEVTGLTHANTIVWREPAPDSSSLVAESAQTRLVIPGGTNWYTTVQARISQLAPESVRMRRLDYSIFRSVLGGLYPVSYTHLRAHET